MCLWPYPYLRCQPPWVTDMVGMCLRTAPESRLPFSRLQDLLFSRVVASGDFHVLSEAGRPSHALESASAPRRHSDQQEAGPHPPAVAMDDAPPPVTGAGTATVPLDTAVLVEWVPVPSTS